MSDDAVVNGIKRRLAGDVEVHEGTFEAVFVAMEWLFKDNGLPSPYGSTATNICGSWAKWPS